ncbi:hypothetical protein [Halovivax sp.]|uniref:hypothetical protein n=1 Tax=Halovivax sp. TaxID=1935978 RepID=UPI0037439303
MRRGRKLGLSVLAVGAAALAGYVVRSERPTREPTRARASIGARIVEEVPPSATVVDVSSRRLGEIPGARRAIDRAVSADDRDRWTEVTFSDDDAWSVVDALRGSLPYHEADDEGYNGVYVKHGEDIVVIDAVGWARVEGVAH